jgi:hypothetical protein
MAFSPNCDHVFPQFPTSSLSWWDTLAAVPGDKQTGERGHIEDMFLEFLCALLVFGQMDKNGVCVFIVYRNSIEMMFFWFNLMLSDFQNHTNTRVCVFFANTDTYLPISIPTYCTYLYLVKCAEGGAIQHCYLLRLLQMYLLEFTYNYKWSYSYYHI